MARRLKCCECERMVNEFNCMPVWFGHAGWIGKYVVTHDYPKPGCDKCFEWVENDDADSDGIKSGYGRRRRFTPIPKWLDYAKCACGQEAAIREHTGDDQRWRYHCKACAEAAQQTAEEVAA